MGFFGALKGALNPFGKSKLNPLNAPGMQKIAGVMGKAPGMQKLGGLPGMRKISQLTPGMRGMFQPKPGIGPSQGMTPPQGMPPPTPQMDPGAGAQQMPQLPPQEGGDMMGGAQGPPPQMQTMGGLGPSMGAMQNMPQLQRKRGWF